MGISALDKYQAHREEQKNSVDLAMQNWKPRLDSIATVMKSHDVKFDSNRRASTAVVLENLYNQFGKLQNDATVASNVGSFIDHGFDLISAFFPTLIAHDIVNVDTLTRRDGRIFFLDYMHGTSRGNITKGDVMFGSRAVGNGNTYYSRQNSIPQVLEEKGDGSTTAFTANIVALPIVEGSVIVRASKTGGFLNVVDNGSGTLTGDGTGTVNYATGAISVTFSTAPLADTPVIVFSSVNFETNPETIPQVDARLTSESVYAEPYKLRARYSIDAEYDLQQAHGISISKALRLAMIEEVRHETDGTILDELLANAGVSAPDWDTTHRDNIAWVDQKEEFWDLALVPGKSKIFQATRKAEADILVGGTQVCDVIETLARFERTGKTQAGPHFIGTISGLKVFKNPFYQPNKYAMTWNSPLPIEAAYKFCPYLPLYVTPVVELDDLIGRFGLIQMYATKVVNSNLIASGKLVGNVIT